MARSWLPRIADGLLLLPLTITVGGQHSVSSSINMGKFLIPAVRTDIHTRQQ